MANVRDKNSDRIVAVKAYWNSKAYGLNDLFSFQHYSEIPENHEPLKRKRTALSDPIYEADYHSVVTEPMIYDRIDRQSHNQNINKLPESAHISVNARFNTAEISMKSFVYFTLFVNKMLPKTEDI
ncbi:hypothetical protein WN51_02125 [Melipona quadrifasciata]|uniref:Uncharacterized protein n=1 Tax=Melipona quadrifasciata TaxID=166423 RepID=A0A0N0U463_9HYME|nr:hypothetical protein WN51_02125 [Melipona quadrifasciata]